MSQYLKTRQWISNAITMVMFANFYYVIGVLCWAVVAPKQGSFISAFQHGGLLVFMLLTLLFLVTLTHRYLRIQRAYGMHKVVARA